MRTVLPPVTWRLITWPLLTLAALLFSGCATPPPAGHTDWQAQPLPGKESTQYEWTQKDGRRALAARSQASASLWRKRLDPAVPVPAEVRFSWWVQDLVPNANVSDLKREDAAARVVFGFAGDVKKLPFRTRALFDMAQALTGEAPPYATLMYVYDSSLPVGSVVVNPRSDRIRKIVLDSGTEPLRRWRDHRRDLAADFRLAFGEEPGALVSVAVMTDSDNTSSQGHTWYGPVSW